MVAKTPRVLGPNDGPSVDLGSVGVRFLIGGQESGGRFSLVEHPMPPHGLGGPLHRHSREDEYTFVLQGRVASLLGEEVVYGQPGDLISKPRNEWHTFWNAGDQPARILEIISPPGFERYFQELSEVQTAGPPDPAKMGAVAARYGLEIDPASIPRLVEQHGLRIGAVD